MDHEGARRLMAEAMEGRLGTDDERELALHLISCNECKVVYEGLQQAHPALSAIELGEPSTPSLDAAVHRATTVLRGDADPGPFGLTDEPPRLDEAPDTTTIRIDSSLGEEQPAFAPAGPMIPTGPMQIDSPTVTPIYPPESHVRPIEADPIEQPVPVADATLDTPSLDDDDDALIDLPPPPAEHVSQPFLDTPTELPDLPRSEIDTLLDEDRTRYEPLPLDEPDDRDRLGPGPWLVAIAVTVALAVLAGILITRGDGLFGGGGGDLPSADRVQSRVERALAEMNSLKASFSLQKLSLYRVGREDDSIVYSFSNGRYTGQIDYDRAQQGYRQSSGLDVGDEELQRTEIAQIADETRSIIGTGADRALRIETNPPLGPPDGAFRPTLGLLEDSLGGAARMIAEATDLEVVGITEVDGRELYEVRATVRPNELTRADRIEAALDANRFLPVIVERSISRENARVLGPSSALTDEALDTAFGENERLTTELLKLTNVQYDEIVLPGDLALEAPDGVETQQSDFKYERLTRAELGSKIDFEPLLPRTLPDNYDETLLAVHTGEPQGWGPNKAYPKPENVFHAQYFNGRTTITITQRRMKERFDVKESPLARAGLPITVRPIERDDKQFFYGSSPEVPPHVYGFLGNVFAMVVGYAPQADLVRIIASLAETPVEVPAPLDASPSPGTSPGASPQVSPLASPASTPAASPAVTTSP